MNANKQMRLANIAVAVEIALIAGNVKRALVSLQELKREIEKAEDDEYAAELKRVREENNG